MELSKYEFCDNMSFCIERVSILKGNKKFELSREFYDAAMLELKRSLKNNEYSGMIVFFRNEGKGLYGNEFYDSEQLIENGYCYKFSYVHPYNGNNLCSTGFGWNFRRIRELESNREDLLIVAQVKPSLASPCSCDMTSPFCKMVVGFDADPLEFKEFNEKKIKLEEINYKDLIKSPFHDGWDKVIDEVCSKNEKVYRMVKDFSEEEYDEFIKKFKPTIRLFYFDGKLKKLPFYYDGKLEEIPLYLDGKLIE